MTTWLVTWLWQGLALTVGVRLAFRLMPRLNGATRYWLWWATLGALGALGASGALGVSMAHSSLPSHLSQPSHLFTIPSAPGALIAIFVGVWVAMALVLLIRVVPGIHTIFRIRDRCTEFPPEVEAELSLWIEERDRRTARPTRLMLCDAVRGATVLGFHRSCIAVPPSLLKALTRDELDQIVLHEYAHVQRWDDWTRLAQAVIQSALWIHPAAALIGRRLDLEREIACDEWVVSRTGLPKLYARCLTHAAEVHGRIGMQLLLGPALFARRRHLVLRVNRLLAARGRTRRNVSVIGAFVGSCALIIFTLQVRAISLVGEIVEVPAVRLEADTAEPAASESVASGFGQTPPVRIEALTVRTANVQDATLLNPRTPEPKNRRTDESPNRRTPEPTNPRTDEPTNQQMFVPSEPVEPAPISARSFSGHYVVAEPSAAPENRGRWDAAGAIGAEIGGSARKGSVALANTFTRAGVSLARRF
jgi:beta-lactamase regulating signal transducer with metallopeptidase domain